MNKAKFYRIAHSECQKLHRLGIIDRATFDKVSALYPISKWDWRTLGRWFLLFGGISTAAGASILFQQYWGFTLENLALILALCFFALLAVAARLKQREMPISAQALELLAGFDLIGLTFTMAAIFSYSLQNWPALLLTDLLVLLLLAYLFHNALILTLCSVVFFTWFGGVTGYISGWGAWFFGMNYPVRFFAVSICMVLAAFAHLHAENNFLARWRGFFKVWLSSGIFFGEMSLWLMSLFGNFGMIDSGWHQADSSELLLFNLLWAAINIAMFICGTKLLLKMMVGYAVTFLTIQGYTVFFKYFVEFVEPTISFLLVGGSALYLVSIIEKKRRTLFAAKESLDE